MPAPTNLTALTAIDIGATLPYSTTQDVHFAGTTYTVWYAYTAQPGDNVIGVFGYGTIGSGYRSRVSVYTGPAAAPTPYLITAAANNRCIYLPVTVGTTYYFEFVASAGNPTPAILTLSVLAHADTAAPAGSIAINDEVAGFPLVLIDRLNTSLNVLQYVQGIVAGEQAATLDSGVVAVEERSVGLSLRIAIYDTAYTEIASVAVGGVNYGRALTSNRVDAFYAAGWAGAVWTAIKFNTAGTILLTTSPLAFPVTGIGVSPDETILYYYLNQGATVIRRWDLVNDVALTDLVTVAGQVTTDLVVLADGRIVIGDATHDTLQIYNPDGTLSASWAVPLIAVGDRLVRDLTDATVVLWHKFPITSPEAFYQITLATGAIPVTIDGSQFVTGVYNMAETATPTERFGNPNSCPLWIVPAAVTTPGTITVIKQTSPGGLPDLFDFTAGGGLSPGSFQLADGGSQLYDPVAVGSGYSIVEAAAPGFSTLISVSNGSPNTNIAVGSGEAVTVTVTNAQQATPGGDGCPLGVPDPVTGEDGCTIPDDF